MKPSEWPESSVCLPATLALTYWCKYWLLIVVGSFSHTHTELSNHRSPPTLDFFGLHVRRVPLSEHDSHLSLLSLSLSLACSKPQHASLCCTIPGIPLCLSLLCSLTMASRSVATFHWKSPLLTCCGTFSFSDELFWLVLPSRCAMLYFFVTCSHRPTLSFGLCLCVWRVCSAWFIHEGQPSDRSSRSHCM